MKRLFTAGLLAGATAIGMKEVFAQVLPSIKSENVISRETIALPRILVYRDGARAIALDEKRRLISKSSDHTAVIQDVLNILDQDRTYNIEFSGKFEIARKITLPSVKVRIFCGEFIAVEPIDAIFNISSALYFEINYAYLNGNSKANYAIYSEFAGQSGYTFRIFGCRIENFNDYAIYLYAPTGNPYGDIKNNFIRYCRAGIFLLDVDDSNIEDNIITGTTGADPNKPDANIALKYADSNRVVNNYLGGSNAYGLWIFSSKHIRAVNNIIDYKKYAGILLYKSNENMFVNTHVTRTSKSGDGVASAVELYISNYNMFVNTFIWSLSTDPRPKAGIYCNSTSSNNLFDNIYVEHTQYAIWDEGLNNVFVRLKTNDVSVKLYGSLGTNTGLEKCEKAFARGLAVLSGDGVTTDFLLGTHGLANELVTDPTKAIVECTPASSDAIAASPVVCYLSDEDADGVYESIRAKFASAPAAGTNNVKVVWEVEYIG